MEPPFLENVRVGGKPKHGPDQPRPRGVVAERNGGDGLGLVLGEQLGRLAPPRLILGINVGERLPAGVADDEAGVGFFGRPGRREAAHGRHQAVGP